MTAKKGKKLCWNCEGEVERDAILCRFCGVNVLHVAPIQPNDDNQIPLPPYGTLSSADQAEEDTESEVEEEVNNEAKSAAFSFPALVAFLLGSFFFLFALFLVCFSKEGILTLRWDASYWLIYVLVSFPLMLVGWRFSRN